MRRMRLVPVLAGLALLGGACGRGGVEEAAPRDAEGGPVDPGASCVESYSPETLPNRSFAFDGTVASIEVREDPRLPEEIEGENQAPWVTFDVNQWFRGGSGSQVGVWVEMLDVSTSAGTIEAEVGTRLLVAGEPRWGGDPLDDPIAWPCGFTQPWTPEATAEWAAAFSR